MPNAEKLHVRMLRACHRSYHIETLADGSHEWSTQPTIIGRNPQAGLPRDLALVGIIPEGILVCCRGTQPPTVKTLKAFLSSFDDWLNNTRVIADNDDRFPGQVHEGFADSALDLWRDHGTDPGIKARLEDLIRQKPGATIYITGHSKGGPLANLIASLVRGLGIESDHLALEPSGVEVVSFAAAKPGNKGFCDTLLGSDVKVTRYEVGTDIVPKLPPSGDASVFLQDLLSQAGVSFADNLIDYQAVGDLILDNGNTFFQFAKWIASLIKKESDILDAPTIIAAHEIKPGSLYDKLVHRGA